MHVIHVDGQNKGKIVLYAISTCPWCKKTKLLLNKLRVEYSYIDVDLLEKDQKDKVEDEVKKWNPKCNYPTIVFNDKKCIVGFKEDEIKEALHV
jgi:glutaredoxin-like protein NrdH